MYTVVAFVTAFSHTPAGRSKKKGIKPQCSVICSGGPGHRRYRQQPRAPVVARGDTACLIKPNKSATSTDKA